MGEIAEYLVDVEGLSRGDAEVREDIYQKVSLSRSQLVSPRFSMTRREVTEAHVDVYAESADEALALVEEHLGWEQPDYIHDDAADLEADFRVHQTIDY